MAEKYVMLLRKFQGMSGCFEGKYEENSAGLSWDAAVQHHRLLNCWWIISDYSLSGEPLLHSFASFLAAALELWSFGPDRHVHRRSPQCRTLTSRFCFYRSDFAVFLTICCVWLSWSHLSDFFQHVYAQTAKLFVHTCFNSVYSTKCRL